MRKPTFSVYKYEDADQLRGNRATGQIAFFVFATKIERSPNLGLKDPIIRRV